MESGKTSSATVLLALVGGAAVGAGIALLYAPQSGRRTRQRLSEFGEDTADCVRGLLSKTEACLEDVCREGYWPHKGHGCSEDKRGRAAAEASRA
jgi:gas vesicle protein